MVVLDEARLDSEGGERALPERLDEEAALVGVDVRAQQHGARQLCRHRPHGRERLGAVQPVSVTERLNVTRREPLRTTMVRVIRSERSLDSPAGRWREATRLTRVLPERVR